MKKFAMVSLAGVVTLGMVAGPATSLASTHEDPSTTDYSDVDTGHEEFNEGFNIYLALTNGDVILRQGDQRSEYVSDVQRLLDTRGFSTNVDGIFGPNTADSVRSYQDTYGLTVDGVVGPNTYQSLSDRHPYPNELFRYGDRGEYVMEIQRFLTEERGMEMAVDGIYGIETERNIRVYQEYSGLQVDGVVGPKTWDSIFTYVR
ncbi:peptidoglycan hydrolase-like protein with peptidoglycan-binding domain [Sinobaca qinghaiensis]|uniref:Peptidoglycan hydrolase-like protein with peptidoglycan-binding domain n=1 Tax=Sinobaca qinghaiensis TaxID=342944 RepID=A0A419V3Y5_9BACL|nr:peptidoglycan-binding protein [Sinobaca qinghaiensis]RKD73152.1 peptidoglycan hydrolase-like protein with peptidoglycan-binding domain [Sinobaca qinghaiensis]